MNLCPALGTRLAGLLKGISGSHVPPRWWPRCSWSDGCCCLCPTVDCWDGPDGEPIVHHGYTLTSKILFKDVIETINKYAFIKNEYVSSLPTFESQGVFLGILVQGVKI